MPYGSVIAWEIVTGVYGERPDSYDDKSATSVIAISDEGDRSDNRDFYVVLRPDGSCFNDDFSWKSEAEAREHLDSRNNEWPR